MKCFNSDIINNYFSNYFIVWLPIEIISERVSKTRKSIEIILKNYYQIILN